MATGGGTPDDARSGISFGVMLQVPWNAPEAYVQLDSSGLSDLVMLPEVLGLTGHWPDPAVVRVTQGRNERSVRALVPDPQIIDNAFHDVTIVDMENTPEPAVSESDLFLLRHQWPRSVVRGMTSAQGDLDNMRLAAKRRYRTSKAGDCAYCGKWIKCDMYRHVSQHHLDLGSCPVSWCTVWKGTPQDCNDHIRGAHDVPPGFKTANLAKYIPPWTVRHQIWVDALLPRHSGVSTEVLLFSELQSALVHHYRVYRKGLPHYAFWIASGGLCLSRRLHLAGALRTFAPVMWRPGLPVRHAVSIHVFAPLASRMSLLMSRLQ